MRDMAHVYRDFRKAVERLEQARSDAEFLSAQAWFEQVEAEWIEWSKKLGFE